MHVEIKEMNKVWDKINQDEEMLEQDEQFKRRKFAHDEDGKILAPFGHYLDISFSWTIRLGNGEICRERSLDWI